MNGLKRYRGRRYVDATFREMALAIQKYDMENLSFFTILKGGMYTAYNVLRYISWPENNAPVFGYLGLSSYRNKIISPENSIQVTYKFDLDEGMIENKNVWVIDDISDTGQTLDYAKGLIESYHPKSFRTMVLVDKEQNRESYYYSKPDEIGFVYEGDEFLVGCGMGLGEEYRHFRSLYEVVEENKEGENA